MPLLSYPITGMVYASDGSTGYAGVSVTLRNITRKSSENITTEADGSFSFNLAEFPGGYSNGDSLKIEAMIGSFYATASITVDTGVAGIDQSLTLATETITRIIEFSRVKEELITFFRKNLADPKSRASFETSTQTGAAGKVKFELPRTDAKFVEYVMVNSVMQSEYSEYYVDYNDSLQVSYPVVYFLTPPAAGSLVEIRYAYGTSWVYPDVPRVDTSLDAFPRVTLKFVSVRTREDGIGAMGNITDILCSLQVWSASQNELMDIITDARTLIAQNKKNIHYFHLMVPGETGPVVPVPGRDEKLISQNQDFMMMLRLEV